MHTCAYNLCRPELLLLLLLPRVVLRALLCWRVLCVRCVLQATGEGGDVHLEDEEQDEGDIYSMYRSVVSSRQGQVGIAACSGGLSALSLDLCECSLIVCITYHQPCEMVLHVLAISNSL